MKLIKNKNKTRIILQDGDILEVETMFRNKIIIQISCNNGVLTIDELIKEERKKTQKKEDN